MSAVVSAYGPDGLRALVGKHVGFSDWVEIDQARVNQFAAATGDYQWIHVDSDRAGESPFGGLVAHGYLTLSLLPVFVPQVISIDGFSAAVNYGTGRVRFPAPVLVGSKLRGGVEIEKVVDIQGGVQMTALVTVEILGGSKPACVAESITRHLV